MVRRVKKDGFTVASGTLTFDRAYANAPASDEVYQVFNFFPPIDQVGVPYSWDRAVREGLGMAWYVDQVDLGAGTSLGANRYSLAAFPDITARTVRRVYVRSVDTNGIVTDQDAQANGRYIVKRENGRDFSIELYPAPLTTENVIVEAVRADNALYVDGDVTTTPFDLAVRAVVLKVYERLNLLQPGKYGGEYAVAVADFDEYRLRYSAEDMVLF
jgi:hypothetical protein